jgi:rare lipoprotein A
MEATAFVRGGHLTASGTVAHEGIVAADPAILPLGSRIRIRGAEAFNGIYTVTDTGGKIVGRHIDLCVRSRAEARHFGKKMVQVQIVSRGTGKQDARDRDIPVHFAVRH